MFKSIFFYLIKFFDNLLRLIKLKNGDNNYVILKKIFKKPFERIDSLIKKKNLLLIKTNFKNRKKKRSDKIGND